MTMRRKKRVARKVAGKKAGMIPKKVDESKLEDWNQVESKLYDSLSEKETEPNKNHSFETEQQPNPYNEWQDDWLFGDMDSAPELNDTDPNKKNPL